VTLKVVRAKLCSYS